MAMMNPKNAPKRKVVAFIFFETTGMKNMKKENAAKKYKAEMR